MESYNPVLLVKEFNIENIRFTKVQDLKSTNGKPVQQQYSDIKYIHQNGDALNLQIQTSKFPLLGGGLPSLKYKINSNRELGHIKIPLDFLNEKEFLGNNENDKDLIEDVKLFKEKTLLLTKMIKQIDEHLSSKEIKQKLFGDQQDKFSYVPIYKSVDKEDSEEKMKKNNNTKIYPIVNTIRLRLKANFDQDDFDIKTKIFLNNTKIDNTSNGLKKEKKVKEEQQNLKFSDLQKMIKYRTNIVVVFEFQKIYINKVATGKTKNYGIILYVNMIDIYPKKYTPLIKALRKNSDESEDDEEQQQQQIEKKIEQISFKKNDSEESEEESESEEEEVVQTKNKGKKN